MIDKPSRGVPTGWVPTVETDHWMVCPNCGQLFDCRDLEKAIEHNHGAEIEMVEIKTPPQTH